MPDAGFATPAAVVVSMAIATVAVVVQVRATEALNASRADLARTRAELSLDGVQAIIAVGLLRQDGAPRGDWDAGEGVTARAEPEAPKLAPALAGRLDASTLQALGAGRPAAVKDGLQRLAASSAVDPELLRTLDASPIWRACARSVISPYGSANAIVPQAPGGAQGHAGEVWRLVARDGSGWTDDRTVRITGDATEPARIIYRSFSRRPGGRPCPIFALVPPPPEGSSPEPGSPGSGLAETPATP